MTIVERTAPALVLEHLAWMRRRNLRPATIEQRRLHLARLAADVGTDTIETLDRATIAEWFQALTMLPEGRATCLSHVRQFYRWLMLEELRDDDPTIRLIRPRIPRRVPRPMPREDMERVFAEAPERFRPWLVLAAYAGLRAAEVAQLRVEDVRDRQRPPVIYVANGKGGHQRVVPMSEELVREYHRWDRPRRGPLFTALDGRPLTAANLCGRVNSWLHDIGVDGSFHTLRHAFATELYRHTHDLRLTQEILGHVSPVTTAGYAAWSPEDGAAGVAGMWS